MPALQAAEGEVQQSVTDPVFRDRILNINSRRTRIGLRLCFYIL